MFRLTTCFVLASATIALAAESPTLIPFQAQLTNQNNVLYESGTYTIIFNLYDQAVGGASLWTERHLQVGVINGSVNIFLGSINTAGLPADKFTKTLYLGITIDADGNANTPDPEMIPRQMIIPAFHAKNSEKLAGHDWSTILVDSSNDPSAAKIRGAAIEPEGITAVQIATQAVGTSEIANGAVQAADIDTGAVRSNEILDGTIVASDLSSSLRIGLTPPGAIVAYWGTVAPAGWLLCHGQSVPSGSQYNDLRQLVGSTVPDLRGLFLRGANAGRTGSWRDEGVGVGANRAIGNLQADVFANHTHTMGVNGLDTGGNTTGVQRYANFTDDGYGAGGKKRTDTTGGGTETRPKNIAVSYLIKY